MNKQKIIIISLLVLLVLSLSYVVWDLSIRVRNGIFLQGYGTAISELMTAVENSQCNPFPVFLEEETVHLLNAQCLENSLIE